MLVVEDLHWADDATLDVLAYAARRIEAAGALLVLTYRDDEVDPGHPLQRLLGVLASCPVHRLELTRAVARGRAEAVRRHRRRPRGGPPHHARQPVLRHRGARVAARRRARDRRWRPCWPASAGSATTAARRSTSCPSCRRTSSLDLAAELLGPRIDALAEAEPAGVIDVRPDSLAFRHELARRAIERSLPALRRRSLNAAVVAALRAQPRPEPARVMHHAVEASDVETILAVGPSAAREAERAGSHRQALAHYESMRPHLHRVPARERAALLDGYGWELYNAHRFRDAVAAGREAAGLYEQLGDPVALGECLVRTSRHLFMAGETDEAERCAQPRAGDPRAGRRRGGAGPRLALHGRDPRAHRRPGARGAAARACARAGRALGTAGPAALALNYLGIARTELGDPSGLALLRRSVEVAIAARRHEYAARGYCNLAEMLGRGGRLDELAAVVDEGLRFARERGFWSHAYNLEVHRCVALVRRGRLGEAESGLRELVEGVDDPGMLYAYSVPWLGRVLARRGDPAAGDMLAAAWERALRQRLLLGLAYAGLASGGVGVAGRRAGGGPARGRRAAAAHRASRRRAVPGRAPALPRARRPARRAVRRLP